MQKCFLNILVSMSFSLILRDVKLNKVLLPPTVSQILQVNGQFKWKVAFMHDLLLTFGTLLRAKVYPSSASQSLCLCLLLYICMCMYNISTLYITWSLQNFVKIRNIALKKDALSTCKRLKSLEISSKYIYFKVFILTRLYIT